jgi:hypothetical protein
LDLQSQSFSVSDLAEAAGVPRRTLVRHNLGHLFLMRVGCSPTVYSGTMTDAQRYHGNLDTNSRYRFSIGAKRLMNDLAGPVQPIIVRWAKNSE